MARAVADDERIGWFAGVAGYYADGAAFARSSPQEYQAAIDRGLAAEKRWQETGIAETIPAVGPDGGDVAMPLREAYEFYGTPRGAVDNYTNDGKDGHRPPEYTTVGKPETKCEGTPSTPPTTAPTTTPATPESPSPTPTETPTLPVPTDAPNVFTPILDEDCTTMTIGADNPADGITWKFDLKTSKGEERSFTLKPGEKHTEKFSATEGFSIKVTISVTVEGKTYSDFDTVKYEKPGDCTGGEGGGGLAKTGTPTAAIAGSAVAILALGAVLFFLARRRKVKFTA